MMLVFGRRSRDWVLSGTFSCINNTDQTQSRIMETPKEYYYTYYSYEEWGRGYFGSRGCECLPEEDVKYFGSFSDKTFKPTQKIILKSDYATREEAYADEIILQQYYKVVENPHFANKAYQTSTKFYIPKEKAKELGKKCGKITYELGVGVHGRTKDKMTEDSKKAGKIVYELGVGIFNMSEEKRIKRNKKSDETNRKNGTGLYGLTTEKRKEAHKKANETNRKNGTGLYGLTTEKRKEAHKKSNETNKKNKTGCCYGLTPEKRIKNGKKFVKLVNSQRWMCEETGHITTPGALTNYQKARGIDTSKRRRIS
jgi:hypothetical protein